MLKIINYRNNRKVTKYALTAFKTSAYSSGVAAKYYYDLTEIPNYNTLKLHENLFYEFTNFVINNAGNGRHFLETTYTPETGEFMLSIYYAPIPSDNNLIFWVVQ